MPRPTAKPDSREEVQRNFPVFWKKRPAFPLSGSLNAETAFQNGRLFLLNFIFVQEEGLEPSWYCYHTDLNRARLPIPPLLHLPFLLLGTYYFTRFFKNVKCFFILFFPVCAVPLRSAGPPPGKLKARSFSGTGFLFLNAGGGT